MAGRPPVVMALGEAAWLTMADQADLLDADALVARAPLLLVIPHPDDETLGCGGLIAQACAQGLDVRVVYLTDGAASHAGSPTWPRQRLAALRRAEALAALFVLGVGEAQVLFLDWPDAEPRPSGSPAFAAAIDAVLDWAATAAIRSILAPYRGEAHCDHAAAYALARALQDRWPGTPTLLEYLVWGWDDPNLPSAHGAERLWRLPCEEHVPRRQGALACHRSQTGAVIRDAQTAFTMPPALMALASRPSEIFLERM